MSHEIIETVLHRCQIDAAIPCPSLQDFYAMCKIEMIRQREKKEIVKPGHYEPPSEKTKKAWEELMGNLHKSNSGLLGKFSTLYTTLLDKGVWVED